MHGFTTIAAPAILLSTAFAVPMTERKAGSQMTQIVPRSNWKGDSDGNLHIEMSDSQLQFGNYKLSDLFDKLKDSCSAISCNDDEVTVETGIVDEHWALWDNDLTVTAKGSVSKNEDGGTLDDLLEAALAAMKEVEETEEWDYHDGVVCNVPSMCESRAKNSDNDPNTEYWYPDEIHLRFEGSSTSYLNLEFSVDSKNSAGFCETLNDVGSKVSAAVGGVGSTPLALIDLFCID